MASKSGRATPKDLKNGKTIWRVFVCFVSNGLLKARSPELHMVSSKPYKGESGRMLYKRYEWFELGNRRTEIFSSLTDRSIDKINDYNLHRCFKSYKKALAYMNRINAQCLTKFEWDVAYRLHGSPKRKNGVDVDALFDAAVAYSF